MFSEENKQSEMGREASTWSSVVGNLEDHVLKNQNKKLRELLAGKNKMQEEISAWAYCRVLKSSEKMRQYIYGLHRKLDPTITDEQIASKLLKAVGYDAMCDRERALPEERDISCAAVIQELKRRCAFAETEAARACRTSLDTLRNWASTMKQLDEAIELIESLEIENHDLKETISTMLSIRPLVKVKRENATTASTSPSTSNTRVSGGVKESVNVGLVERKEQKDKVGGNVSEKKKKKKAKGEVEAFAGSSGAVKEKRKKAKGEVEAFTGSSGAVKKKKKKAKGEVEAIAGSSGAVKKKKKRGCPPNKNWKKTMKEALGSKYKPRMINQCRVCYWRAPSVVQWRKHERGHYMASVKGRKIQSRNPMDVEWTRVSLGGELTAYHISIGRIFVAEDGFYDRNKDMDAAEGWNPFNVALFKESADLQRHLEAGRCSRSGEMELGPKTLSTKEYMMSLYSDSEEE